MTMFGERNDWYEVQQVCIHCGTLFMADYKYHMVCRDCYADKADEDDEIKENVGESKGSGGVVGNTTADSDSNI